MCRLAAARRMSKPSQMLELSWSWRLKISRQKLRAWLNRLLSTLPRLVFWIHERIQLSESQIIKWRYRLPELTDDEDTSTIVPAVEAQEQLSAFRDLTRTKIHEIRLETSSLEANIGVLERARSESWELISNRLNSTLDRTANTLSDRMTELEHTVQSQRTTPATDSSQP